MLSKHKVLNGRACSEFNIQQVLSTSSVQGKGKQMIYGTILEKLQIILEYDKVLDQKVGEKNYPSSK